MHEYHIVETIVNQVVVSAKNGGADKITKVTLVMGEASGLEESSVRLYFENIVKGTLAQGAELVLHKIKTELECKACGIKFSREKSRFECPKCSGLGTATKAGREFYIESIEVETPE